MERCPVCRARLKGKTVCHRCNSDLGPLYILENQADWLLARAMRALQAGDISLARRCCIRAGNVKHSGFADVLLDFLNMLERLTTPHNFPG